MFSVGDFSPMGDNRPTLGWFFWRISVQQVPARSFFGNCETFIHIGAKSVELPSEWLGCIDVQVATPVWSD